MANREPNFKNDNRIGEIGENDFHHLMEINNRNIIDVSGDWFFRAKDVDFVELIEYKDLNEVKYWYSTHIKPNETSFEKYFKLYEIKTDTVTLKTRNILYEVISHDNAGCMAKTDADIIIYYIINDKEEIVERYSILTKKWRKWIRENYKELKTSNSQIMRLNNHVSNEHGIDDGNLDILCNIDKMVEDKIAIKF